MNKISIIIPVYNSEFFLEKCVNSLINQTYNNIEILLINDGSTDESLNICNKLSKKDNRIKVYNKENGGVSSARRLGLQRSTGNYIGFVDSDDYIDPIMYEKMLSTLKKYSADIVECGFYNINDDGIVGGSNLNFEIIEGKEKNIANTIKTTNMYNQLWNKLYKKELFNLIDIKNFHYSEDYFTNVQLASKVSRKIIIGDKLYYYYDNIRGAMNADFSYKKFDRLTVREVIFKEYYKDKNLRAYIALEILKVIVILYVNLHNSNFNEVTERKNYLIDKFNKYIKFTPFNMLRKVRPFKLNISMLLFRLSPKLFESILSISFNKYKIFNRRLEN